MFPTPHYNFRLSFTFVFRTPTGYHEDLPISSHIIPQNFGLVRVGLGPEPPPDTATTPVTTASARRPPLSR